MPSITLYLLEVWGVKSLLDSFGVVKGRDGGRGWPKCDEPGYDNYKAYRP